MSASCSPDSLSGLLKEYNKIAPQTIKSATKAGLYHGTEFLYTPLHISTAPFSGFWVAWR